MANYNNDVFDMVAGSDTNQANALNAPSGASDAGETKHWRSTKDALHAAGMVPGPAGAMADATNFALSVATGDFENALWSLAGFVPILGLSTGAFRSFRSVKEARQAADRIKNARKVSDKLLGTRKVTPQIKKQWNEWMDRNQMDLYMRQAKEAVSPRVQKQFNKWIGRDDSRLLGKQAEWLKDATKSFEAGPKRYPKPKRYPTGTKIINEGTRLGVLPLAAKVKPVSPSSARTAEIFNLLLKTGTATFGLKALHDATMNVSPAETTGNPQGHSLTPEEYDRLRNNQERLIEDMVRSTSARGILRSIWEERRAESGDLMPDQSY
jgi:hypothetical protein